MLPGRELLVRNNRKRYQARGRAETGRKMSGLLLKLIITSVVLAVAGGVGFLGYGGLTQSRLFRISAIEIDGCQKISEQEVLGLSGIDVHSNLVKLNVKQIKEGLERHDWIERVMISRQWPDRLTIAVKERTPAAVINLDDGLHYVDRNGKVFAPVDEMAGLDYPVITGAEGAGSESLPELSALHDALLLIKYASRDNPNLPAQNISEINIGNNDIVLFLMDRPFPIHLGQGDIWKKYSRLAKVLYWLYKRKEFSRVAYVYYAKDNILVGMGNG